MSLRLAAVTTAFALSLFAPGCALNAGAKRSPQGLAELRLAHDRLHAVLQEAVARDAIATRAFADPGQIVVAIRSQWVEELMERVAVQYLDKVTLDLAELEVQAGGTIKAGTFLGQVKVGDWRVEMTVESLRGHLSAGEPSLTFGDGGLLNIALPARVRPSPGRVSIRFLWDSAGLANVVCRDFDLTRDLEGQVLAQRHDLAGAVRFVSEQGTIAAIPLFPDRRVAVRVDLTPESWALVEAALRSQDSLGRCGALLKPEVVLEKLRELAEKGIAVILPEVIFRTVRLPARVEKAVGVGGRSVGLVVAAERLKSSTTLLWSSASVKVDKAPPLGAKATSP